MNLLKKYILVILTDTHTDSGKYFESKCQEAKMSQ